MGLLLRYLDPDSEEYEVGRSDVRPENVHVDQVGDVQGVSEYEPLVTDLKWIISEISANWRYGNRKNDFDEISTHLWHIVFHWTPKEEVLLSFANK